MTQPPDDHVNPLDPRGHRGPAGDVPPAPQPAPGGTSATAGTEDAGPARTHPGDPSGQDQPDPSGRRVPPATPGPQNTDPDPGDTPGLEAGGGVQPGDTPPIESGTSGLSADQPDGPGRRYNLLIAVGVFVVAAVGGVALLVGRLAGG